MTLKSLRFYLICLYFLAPFLAQAQVSQCVVKLSYNWEKDLGGGKKELKWEWYKQIKERGSSAEYMRTRLSRLLDKFREETLAVCKGRHEGAELCLVDKLSAINTKLYQLSLEKRQEVIARAKKECADGAGRCIKANVSEIECSSDQ